jgi:hypothetical protein
MSQQNGTSTWTYLLGTVYWNVPDFQYSETNVMNFLFDLLRINGIYMFRALLAHPQYMLHKRHLVYCVRTHTTYQVPVV